MKVRALLIIVLVVFIPLVVVSDTQDRFKICIITDLKDAAERDVYLHSRLETFVSRELRLLGDVDIVSPEANWTYSVVIQILPTTTKDGRKTGWNSIAVGLFSAVPSSMFQHEYMRNLKFGSLKPVHIHTIIPVYWHQDDFDSLAIELAGIINKSLNVTRGYLKR